MNIYKTIIKSAQKQYDTNNVYKFISMQRTFIFNNDITISVSSPNSICLYKKTEEEEEEEEEEEIFYYNFITKIWEKRFISSNPFQYYHNNLFDVIDIVEQYLTTLGIPLEINNL